MIALAIVIVAASILLAALTVAVVFVLMAIINIALSLLVSKKYGALGACVAIFIAYMFRVIAMNYLYNKKLHLAHLCF